MAELEQNLIEVVNRLSGKMDSYEKHITTIGSDLSKVQSQVDLSMLSIQALQKKQVLLLQAINSPGNSSGSGNTQGVIGQAPATMQTISSSSVPPSPPQHQNHGGAGFESSPQVQLGGLH
jgi:hypothetical protein